jgi:integrase
MLDRKFVRLMTSYSSMADLQGILRRELARVIEEDKQRHFSTPPGRPVYAHDVEGWDVLSADLQQIEWDLVDAKADLQRRDTGGIAEWIDDLMAEHGVPADRRTELALGLAQVRIQRLEQSRRHLLDGVTPQISIEPPARSEPKVVALEESGPSLSEVLPGFVDFMSTEKGWRGQTLLQNKNTYRIFEQLCGDLPITHYKKSHLTAMYDLLRALPAMYGKAARWKGMTPMAIADATKGEDIERLAMKTIKRHFAALGGLFGYFIKRGQYEGANPAYGFDFPMKGRPSQQRKLWDSQRLRLLFASPVWAGCAARSKRSRPGDLVFKDEKYWLPLLGIYHGNRLEEFAQLVRGDVREEEGILYFDINDEADKQVKNEQSKRRVPIHPKLIELGFIPYVFETAPLPGDPIFPQLKPGGADGKRGHAFTKWWTRYRREIGVYDEDIDYHSFRHNVTTKLFELDVSEALIDELTGHEGKGTSRRVYKKDMPLWKLHEAIAKVDWPEVVL